VGEWVEKLADQNRRFLDFEGNNAARMVNNLDWTSGYSAIDFLREIGKHFRVGKMLSKDAVSARLNSDSGISYTEFSYQVLQGMDFLELYQRYGCVMQTGGSDQWGNLTAGTDLVHKVEGKSVHLIATPLITNADGKKFGKSEGNAIWLDAELTSPYAMYQFWLNTDDADVIDRLKVFTFLTRAEIAEYEAMVRDEPFKREAQRRLALRSPSWFTRKRRQKQLEMPPWRCLAKGRFALWMKRPCIQPEGTSQREMQAGASVIDALVATGPGIEQLGCQKSN
jgi:tyrosyl-tRNA synthetase